MKFWAIIQEHARRETHVVPRDDDKDHDNTPDCWCRPRQDIIAANMYVHNALDGRERYEHAIN